MSASHKKQLRKEQNAARMTEKQLAEQKEAKKLRRYSIAFTAAIILMVVIAAFSVVSNSGVIERNTTAVTVDGTKISTVELNYYYIDTINNYINQWGDYISLTGLDTTKPLDEQFAEGETTWADHFLQAATNDIHSVYAAYNKAVAEGYTLDDAAANEIDATLANMELYAKLYYGYSDLTSYMVAMYGKGANADSYRDYAAAQYIAAQYASDHNDTLSYTDEDLAAVLAENPKAYNAYSYNYYLLSTSSFLTGGTTDAEGKTTYSDEEKAASVEACKAAAESLAAQEITSVEDLNKAIAALEINAGKENVTSTAVTDRMYTQLTGAMQAWLTDDSRVAGDVGCVPNESTSTDAEGNSTTTVNGYYIVLFNGVQDNTYLMNNVRHILVAFEGGTPDESGTTIYSDEEKAAAKAAAEEILASYEAGEKTEEAFTALALEHSDDVDSNGNVNNEGLYENIVPSSQYVANFLNWAIDDVRVTGDTGIVETEYGYHVMYFVGDSELTYRDYMITQELRSTDMTEWEKALVEGAVMTLVNTGKVRTDLVLGQPA